MDVIAFDLGGTHLRCGIVDTSCNLQRVRKRRVSGLADAASEDVWGAVIEAIAEYEAEARSAVHACAPIVFAFPGPVAADRRILQAPTVAGGGPVRDVAAEIEARTNRKVYLLNDVSSAAWYFSRRTEARRFLVVTVSSGIGSKLSFRTNASYVLDDPPYAGEIGHYVVDDALDAPLCDCGGRGHLGAIASGRGIERAARRFAEREGTAFASSKAAELAHGRAQALTNEHHLVPAALAGDVWSWGVIERCTVPLARTITAVTMAAGLERVFVIGGFAQALGAPYHQLLTRLADQCSRYEIVEDGFRSMLHVAEQGEEACLKGCGAFMHAKGETH